MLARSASQVTRMLVQWKFIPPEHLLHLVNKLGIKNEEDLKKLQQKAKSSREDARRDVLMTLEKANAGTAERLAELWSFESTHAFFMWRLLQLRSLENLTDPTPVVADALSRALNKKIKPSEIGPDWINIPRRAQRKKPGFSRVASVRKHADQIEAVIYIDKAVTIRHEQSYKEDVRTSRIDVSLEIGADAPLIKAFASKYDARQAALTLLSWLWGRRIDYVLAEHAEILKPLSFREPYIRRLKNEMGLSQFEVHGDAQDANMKKTLRGMQVGDLPSKLDESNAEVKAMDDADLDRRGLLFPYTHPDGFLETAQVRFFLDDKQAHITFMGQTSRQAVDYVVNLVYTDALAEKD